MEFCSGANSSTTINYTYIHICVYIYIYITKLTIYIQYVCIVKQRYLIMEYCSGGELFDHIVASGRVREKEALSAQQTVLDYTRLYCTILYCTRINEN